MVNTEILLVPRTGLRLRNPVMTASGTFGYGLEYAERMDISALGAIVSKGTTREPRGGNEPLRMVETAAGMLNSIGLMNVGIDAVVVEKAPMWAELKVPVFVNVSGGSVEDYAYLATRLDGVAGVSGIEVNVSCPNVKEGGVQFGTDARLTYEVTAAVRGETDLPLVVKLSPNVADIRPIAAAAELAGADAVSLINTVYGMTIDLAHRRPALANVSGGLSGPAIKPLALYLVYQVAQEVSIPIVGIGGIMNGRDALEFLMAGASAVQLGTALLVDPSAWRTVLAEIEGWCRREGIVHIDDVIGAANPGYKARTGERSLTGS